MTHLSRRRTQLGCLFTGMLLAAAGTVPAADTWTGGASPNNNWSAAGNWKAGTVPNSFDALSFTNQTGAAQTPNNDLAAGTPFNGITFSSSGAGSTFNLTGNGLLLSGATNGITLGVSNATALAETVGLNLTDDWGFYTFASPAGSLSLNGTLTRNAGSVAGFGSGVQSTSFTTDAGGLITGLDGAGLMANGANITGLATVSGGTVTTYGYGAAGDQSLVAAAQINSGVNDNVKLTPTASTTYTLPAGTVYVNTIVNVSPSIVATINPGTGQSLVMGKTGLIGETMGGTTGTTKNMITIGGNGSLSAGGNSAGAGTLVFAVGGGNNNGNNIQITAAGGVIDNPAGGAVTVVVAGTGSMYLNVNGTYSGGTCLCQGIYLQGNNQAAGPNIAKPFGTGPIYIAQNSTLYPNVNGKATTAGQVIFPNQLYLSPGLGYSGSLGDIKAGNETFSNTITLMGANANGVAGAGDRFAQTVNSASPPLILSGQITGSGTLEFNSQVATGNFLISNNVPNANNWTGGLIVDNTGNNASFVKIGANNQLAGNNVTLAQSGTGTARLDLNGFNDSVGALSATANANNQVGNFGATASVLTIGANNASGTFAGVISGSSGLTLVKAGTGTQILSGANTYTGNTVIDGGTLALSVGGSLSSATVTVSNATFDVSASGSYGGTANIGMTNGTFNLGTVLATAVGGLGITNSTVQFVLNVSTPTVTVSGSLVTGGSTNVINLTSVPGFGSYPQDIPLIKYGSFVNVDANNDLTNLGVNLPVLGNPAGYLTNNAANGSVDLVLTGGPVPVVPITWNGQTNGVNTTSWDILTTPDWVTTSGLTSYGYQNTSYLTFDDTAAGTTTVSINSTVLPGGINVANTNKVYTFTGTGIISGSTGLTNNGAGTLILTENGGDNYSGGIVVNSGKTIIDNNSGGVNGGTTINGGILQIGNNDGGGVLPAGGLTDNGTLVFNRTDAALNLTAAITGITGTLTNLGSGTVTLSAGANSPATVVNAGILKLNAGGGNGCIANSITVNAGGELDLNANDSIGYNPTLPPLIVSGTVKKLNSQSETLGRVIILSGGTLASTIPGVEQFQTQNNYIDTAAGTANFISGPGRFGLRIASCYITNEAGSTLTISSVIDTNANAGGNTSQLNKWGTGIMILTATNTYTGGTTINNGPLQLGTAADTAVLTAPLGLGPVTLAHGGVLNFASGKGAVVTNVISDDNSGTVFVSSGTNILGGANTYTGSTIINAGTTLALKNGASISSSALVTVSNGTLDLSGGSAASGTGALSLTNSTLVLGTNVINSLGSLSASNGTLVLAVSQGSINITVNNAFAIGDGTNVINITAIPGYSAFPTNITLIKYGSFANVDGGNNFTNLGLKLPALGNPTGYLTNNAVNGSVDLVLLSDSLLPVFPITWTGRTNGLNGASAGNWDVLISSNWVLTADGVTGYKYQDTSAVTFDDTAPGTTTVNLTTTLQPGSLTVSNASKTYTFRGAGNITGIEGLVKLNSGNAIFAETGTDSFSGGVYVGGGGLTLSNANASILGGLTVGAGALTNQSGGTIGGGLVLNGGEVVLDQSGTVTGNTTINAGTLQIGNNDAGGNLTTGNLTDGDTLIFDRSDAALSITTVIAGSGQVINNGTGSVTINGTDTYTGPTTVNAGVLHLNGPNAAASTISASSGLTINNGGTVMLDADNSMGNPTTGGGLPVTINAGGVLTGNPAADAGGGTSSHIRGLLTLNGGTLAMGGTQNQAHGSWNLDNGVDTIASSTTATITASNVVPSHAGSTTFDVPAGTTTNGIDLLVSGTLNSASSLADTGFTKTDTGTMVLDNNNTYAHGTTLSGGTLQLGMPGDAALLLTPLGTGTVTINAPGCVLLFGSSAGATVGNVISDDNQADSLVLVTGGSNTLNAADTYTSPTVISNGTLIVNGSLASSNVTTLLHGTLGGNGTISNGVTNNGTLMPGTLTAVGALTCSSDVQALAGSTTLFKLNKAASPSNDVLNVSGSLTYAGTLKVLNLGGTYNVGDTFRVANVTGSINGSFSVTNLPAIGGGLGLAWNPATATLSVVQTVNVNPTNITAVVSGGTLTLSWPADHTGWRLQVQTNTLSAGLNPANSAWFTVAGSAAVDSVNIPVNVNPGAVFYRMVYP